MSKSEQETSEEDYREKFIGAVCIYNKFNDEEVKNYAANIIADGFVKYSGSNDKRDKATLEAVREDVVKHKELVDVISEKAKKTGIKVSVGEYTERYNGNNKGKEKSIKR